MSVAHPSELLDLGVHCSDSHCHQLDFLPFSCPCCQLSFCQEHWKPESHSCVKYKPNNDVIIPQCPLCSVPVSFPRNTDPNRAMDRHLSESCKVLNPVAPRPRRSNGQPMSLCDHAKCKTKMVVPIQCKDCRQYFCPSHRFGKDHACASLSGPKAAAGASSAGAARRSQPVTMSGLAALRRAQNQLKEAASFKDLSPDFSKLTAGLKAPSQGIAQAKHAKAQEESAKKAFEARAKKGLLTQKEKIAYATEQAEKAKRMKSPKKEACVVS